MPERRKYIRLDSSIDIEYATTGRHIVGNQAKSKNISAGGVQVALKEKLPLNSQLNMKFVLPGDLKPISVIGQIVWQQPQNIHGEYNTGVQYVQIESDDIQRITDYVLRCINVRLSETKKKIDVGKSIQGFLYHEIRLPYDKSKDIIPPDFLTHEVNLPGDKVRYARISSAMALHYRLSRPGVNAALFDHAVSQYIGSKGVWFLAEKAMDKGARVDLVLELPDKQPTISTFGEIFSCTEEKRVNDIQKKSYYEINAKFTDVLPQDRKRIIRYVYSCKADYMMIGKVPPPGWLRFED